MAQLAALFVLTFLESVAGTLIQRGLYFFTHENMGFSETRNLWIAFGFGLAYIGGAFFSHGVAARLGERRALLLCLLGLLTCHVSLALFLTPGLLVVAVLATAAIQGLKWPLVESYVSAGRPPRQLLRTLGRFNVTWATAGFVAIGVTGVIVDSGSPALFFWLPAALNLTAIALSFALRPRPLHLEHSHPERPPESALRDMRALLTSARWSMTASYALLYVIAPLMPTLLAKLALPVALATPVASILDAVRVVTFGVLGAVAGWHGRKAPMWLALLGLVVGFLLILLGGSLGLVVAGEALFGASAGFVYTASLYYALVAENASVDAGGAHESLIGIGIGLGPLSGLAGQLLSSSNVLGDEKVLGPFGALLLTTGPILAVCGFGALRSLFRPPGRPA